jgi:hypothetical protein
MGCGIAGRDTLRQSYSLGNLLGGIFRLAKKKRASLPRFGCPFPTLWRRLTFHFSSYCPLTGEFTALSSINALRLSVETALVKFFLSWLFCF